MKKRGKRLTREEWEMIQQIIIHQINLNSANGRHSPEYEKLVDKIYEIYKYMKYSKNGGDKESKA